VIDTKNAHGHESLANCAGRRASGMAIDVKNHRLFSAATQADVMMDSTNGKVLASVPIGEGVDGAAFDPETKLAFASAATARRRLLVKDGDKLTVVQTLATAPRARTMTMIPRRTKFICPQRNFENSNQRNFRQWTPASEN